VYAKLWERIREKRKDLAYKPLVGKRKRERERESKKERERERKREKERGRKRKELFVSKNIETKKKRYPTSKCPNKSVNPVRV
jgi:hypothetical protein